MTQARSAAPAPRAPLSVILLLWLAASLGCPALSTSAYAQHTDPINLTPAVRAAQREFYNLDYAAALTHFEAIRREHPDNAMAVDYVLLTVVFRELYHQDLLDTTYYAHDSFLTSKRQVDVDPEIRKSIEDLTNQAIDLCDRTLKANPRDANAYFERGFARGLHASFITLVDHSFAAAARQGYASRNDSEQALSIDPDYADAKMAVGIQLFAVASLPRMVRLLVGIFGVGGNREQGLALIREAEAHGVVTNVDSRTVLSLFLRHEGQYPAALEVEHGLAVQFPHDYLFRLEEANLTKDEGNGPAAIAAYQRVIADAKKPGFFADPRLQMAWFGLADTERGQDHIAAAAKDYITAAEQPHASEWLRRRAQLNAGQMYDLLNNRSEAVRLYQMAAAGGGDQSQADAARRYLKTPYHGI